MAEVCAVATEHIDPEGLQLIGSNVFVEAGDLVLLMAQRNPEQNGVWRVSEFGWEYLGQPKFVVGKGGSSDGQ